MPASPPLGILSTGASCLNVTAVIMSAHAYAMLHEIVLRDRMYNFYITTAMAMAACC